MEEEFQLITNWTMRHSWKLQTTLTVMTSCTLLHCQSTSQPTTVQDTVIPSHLTLSTIKVELKMDPSDYWSVTLRDSARSDHLGRETKLVATTGRVREFMVSCRILIVRSEISAVRCYDQTRTRAASIFFIFPSDLGLYMNPLSGWR